MSSSLRLAIAFAATIIGASNAYAQASPSAYTSGARYDLAGRVTGTIAPDPDGTGALKYAATRTTYDSAGRPIKVETGELATWQSEAVAPSAWTGFTILSYVETTYDVMDRKTKVTVKGSDGNPTAITQYSYDTLGRPDCTAVRMNPSIYASLPASACTLGTEGSQGPDRITKNVYDAASQVLKVQKAVGTPIAQDYVTYTYTNNGKQASVKDANGNLASLTYDGHDRQVKWNFPSKTTVGTVSATDYEQYGYDANGNRTALRKRDGSTLTYTYDALSRNTVKIVPERVGLPVTHTRDVYYGYDLRSLQLYARFDSTSGEGITSTYDGFGRLASSSINMDSVTRTLGYSYDKNGSRLSLTHPDSAVFNSTYDGLNRMKELLQASTSLDTMTYNNRGLRATLAGGVATSYGYSPSGLLNALSHDLASTGNDVSYTFAYNNAQQIVTRTTSNDAYVNVPTNANTGYAVNGLNQYSTVGGTGYSYDENGNLTSDGASTYLYDIENRLVTASGATTAGLRYDPLGRLYETTGAATTRFLYDGDELVAEYNSAGTPLRRYVHGASVDDPMVWYEGSGIGSAILRRFRSNYQGSVVAVTDNAGTSIAINSYDEWGVPAAANVGRFQYTGQAYIPELKMFYYKARIYAPKLGRFMQTDPIGYADQVNLYAYAANDPVNMTDPSGNQYAQRDDQKKVVYVYPRYTNDHVQERHGAESPILANVTQYNDAMTKEQMGVLAGVTIQLAEAEGNVKMQGNRSVFEAPITGIINSLGTRGEDSNRVVSVPLSDVSNPELAASAIADLVSPAMLATMAAAELTFGDGFTTDDVLEKVEVQVIITQYPVLP